MTHGTETHPQPEHVRSCCAVLGISLSWAEPSEELDKALPPVPAKVRNVSTMAAQRTRKEIILLEVREASPIPASSSLF